MAINWSVSQYDDGTNKQWRLVSEFAWLTIPGDGSEAQLARMTQGEPAGVGPNAWAVLEGMQKLQRQYAAAVAAGSTSGFEAEVVKLREAIDSLELATPEAVAQAVRDEIIKPD